MIPSPSGASAALFLQCSRTRSGSGRAAIYHVSTTRVQEFIARACQPVSLPDEQDEKAH